MADPVFVSVRLTPTDRDRFMSEYAAPLQSHNAAHGVEVLAGDADPRVIEGAPPPRLNVLLKFPSMDAFDAWYSAPDYQPLKQKRIETTDHASTEMIVLKAYGAA
ncbi:MAG: DUF1330 domain-containing protein [Pseudomonadota bacterium]